MDVGMGMALRAGLEGTKLRTLWMAGMLMMAATAWCQEAGTDHAFIQGWRGHFAQGETVTLVSADLTWEDSGILGISLGDHPDIGQCTKGKRQAVYEWNNDTVAFQVDADEFTEGEQVYVFLIGEEGAASPGYPVTLGDQIPRTEGPGQPGQPFVVEP